MLDAVVKHLVVHLVGINDQVMLAGDVDDFAQQIVRIKRTRRIVRIDQDNRTRMGVDFAAAFTAVFAAGLALAGALATAGFFVAFAAGLAVALGADAAFAGLRAALVLVGTRGGIAVTPQEVNFAHYGAGMHFFQVFSVNRWR